MPDAGRQSESGFAHPLTTSTKRLGAAKRLAELFRRASLHYVRARRDRRGDAVDA